MTPDAIKQIKSAATISAVGVAALTGVLVLAPDPTPQRPPANQRNMEISWQNCLGANVSVVEGSQDGKSWWLIARHTNQNFEQLSRIVVRGLSNEMIRVGHPTNISGTYWRRL